MNPAEDNEPFVTPEEAADFLKISPVTVKKLAREGWLPTSHRQRSPQALAFPNF
jgi:Mn-dependent DtxR family transcriptional regulator